MWTPHRYIANEQGSVLPIAMLTMLIVTIMATSAMYMSFSDFQLTTREAQQSQARALSEAAVTQAKAYIRDEVARGNYNVDYEQPATTLFSTGTYAYDIDYRSNGLTTDYIIRATGTSTNRTVNNQVTLQLVRQDQLQRFAVMANAELNISDNGGGPGITLRSGTYFANDGINIADGTKFKAKQEVWLVTPETVAHGDLYSGSGGGAGHGGGGGGGANRMYVDEDAETLAYPQVDVEELISRLETEGYTVEYYDHDLNIGDDAADWQRRQGHKRGGGSTEPVVMIVDGDVKITAGADLGSNTKPAMLIVVGEGHDVEMMARAKIFGVIYTEQGDIIVNDNGDHTTRVEGILMSGGSVEIKGPARIWDGSDDAEDAGYFDALNESLSTIFDLNTTSWEEQ